MLQWRLSTDNHKPTTVPCVLGSSPLKPWTGSCYSAYITAYSSFSATIILYIYLIYKTVLRRRRRVVVTLMLQRSASLIPRRPCHC